jgi:hypothetical protein
MREGWFACVLHVSLSQQRDVGRSSAEKIFLSAGRASFFPDQRPLELLPRYGSKYIIFCHEAEIPKKFLIFEKSGGKPSIAAFDSLILPGS